MKAIKVILAVMFISLTTISAQEENNLAVKKVVEQYVKAIDNRNVDQLEKVLADNCTITNINKVTNKTTNLSKDDLINLIQESKTGGWQRNLNIKSVDVTGKAATAKFEIIDSKINQNGFITLLEDNNGWKIVNGVSTIETKE